MDRRQQKTLEAFGYAIEDLPNLKTVPKMTYITSDGRELHNLPADAYHMARYLSRGFKPKLASTPTEKTSEAKVGVRKRGRPRKNKRKERKV